MLAELSQRTEPEAMTILPDGEILLAGGTETPLSYGAFLAKYEESGVPGAYETTPRTTSYTYDVKNKLSSVSVNGTTEATYTYDDAGNRVSETVGGVTTLYLNDAMNLTGYAEPLEAKITATGKPITTWITGDRVYGQADANGGMTYLLADGHGSTRLLTNANGTVTAAFNYDAFGTALNFNPGMVATPYLFGGDAFYDAPSGLYIHGDGTRARSGFFFVERDTFEGTTWDPLSLHKYLYANSNPVSQIDPTGHDGELDASGGLLAAVGGAVATVGLWATGLGEIALGLGVVGAQIFGIDYALAGTGALIAYAADDISDYVADTQLQDEALLGLEVSGFLIAGGLATQLVGGALVAAGSYAVALSGKGYYDVNGFLFTPYYYNKLWSTGRPYPTLIAQMILDGSDGSFVSSNKPGFNLYVFDGWELVYNPITHEIYHLQPV